MGYITMFLDELLKVSNEFQSSFELMGYITHVNKDGKVLVHFCFKALSSLWVI